MSMLPSVPWNPKFAKEGAAKSCELRIRDTSVAVQKSASLPPLVRDCGLLNQSHTRNNKLLVSLGIRSSQSKVPRNHANFGFGTLVWRFRSPHHYRRLFVIADF